MRCANLCRPIVYKIAALGVILTLPISAARPASAMTPAENYVSVNVQKGLAILENTSLSKDQRRDQIQNFLLSMTDVKRLAIFTLGQYRRTASPADMDRFTARFQDFAIATYLFYFSQFSGQTLKVTGSEEAGPSDFVVNSIMIDAHASQGSKPLDVSFRVMNTNGKFAVDDVAVSGIWMGLNDRDQFVSFLGQNNGNVGLLADSLGKAAKNIN